MVQRERQFHPLVRPKRASAEQPGNPQPDINDELAQLRQRAWSVGAILAGKNRREQEVPASRQPDADSGRPNGTGCEGPEGQNLACFMPQDDTFDGAW
jgi:hypothetical protein